MITGTGVVWGSNPTLSTPLFSVGYLLPTLRVAQGALDRGGGQGAGLVLAHRCALELGLVLAHRCALGLGLVLAHRCALGLGLPLFGPQFLSCHGSSLDWLGKHLQKCPRDQAGDVRCAVGLWGAWGAGGQGPV